MLKVKRSSWHYWLWKLGRDSNSKPHNLCKYFWHIALVKILFPGIAAAFVLLGVGALAYVIYGHPLATGLTVLGVGVGVALGVGLIMLARKRWATRSRRRRDRRMSLVPRPPKPPSLLKQMIKARKQQMCPLIEVVDE